MLLDAGQKGLPLPFALAGLVNVLTVLLGVAFCHLGRGRLKAFSLSTFSADDARSGVVRPGSGCRFLEFGTHQGGVLSKQDMPANMCTDC